MGNGGRVGNRDGIPGRETSQAKICRQERTRYVWGQGSTILPTNRLEGNLRTGVMFLEHFAQNPEAHPRFSKQAVSHVNGGWKMNIQKAQ